MCLKTNLICFLAPPTPGGLRGEGPDCNVPKEIVGFGPIPARILGFCISSLALSTALLGPDWRPIGALLAPLLAPYWGPSGALLVTLGHAIVLAVPGPGARPSTFGQRYHHNPSCA